jgi:transglutaminase-like putative cysteine protease
MSPKMCFAVLMICGTFKLNAQYPVSQIPDSLTKGARVVVRLQERIYEIKSPGKAVEHEQRVCTIMNESGSGFGEYTTFYNKFISLNNVTGILYDANGKEIKRIKKKDMSDHSGSDDETLMTDTRYKEYDFGYGIYPYTVNFEEEDDIDGFTDIGGWLPQATPGMAVQESRFVVIAPKDYVLRYKSLNNAPEPVITEQSDKKVYTWDIKNLPAKQSEVHSPEWSQIVPYVMVSPSLFEEEGYKGDMSTWLSYGKFYYDLLQGRDVLPDDVKQKVHELTDKLNSPYDKIYAMYDYLQKNTRYISIQLGIGGFQPFDANFVATKHYGDCKALSNYMVSLLKECGIKANSVIIKSGSDALPVQESFPSDQFDHVVACVPLEKDTVWLECTSQTESPGFMGAFTGNRKALLVNETGGYLVSTPAYTANENVRINKIDAAIDNDGNLSADLNTCYKGIMEELPHSLMYDASKEQRERYLNYVLNLPTYQVDKNDYKEKKGRLPEVDATMHITSPAYASVTGKRLFLSPNLFNKSQERLSTDSARKYDIEYRFGYSYIDSVNVKIPDGYTPEAVPKNVSISNEFGVYNITIKIDGSNISCVRYYENKTGRFPAGDYQQLVKFYDDMYKADRSKIVFVKKDS